MPATRDPSPADLYSDPSEDTSYYHVAGESWADRPEPISPARLLLVIGGLLIAGAVVYLLTVLAFVAGPGR